MNKKLLTYTLVIIGLLLAIWSSSYFPENQPEPWRNFKWQLNAMAFILWGLAYRITKPPEWLPDFSRRLSPILALLLIVIGIIIFLLSWL
jgi:hypothetical protein